MMMTGTGNIHDQYAVLSENNNNLIQDLYAGKRSLIIENFDSAINVPTGGKFCNIQGWSS